MRIKLGYTLNINVVAKFCKGMLLSKKNAKINYISTDSREVKEGDLFFCLKGERYDGENFRNDAAKSGAFVVSKEKEENGIQVDSPELSLMYLAKEYIRNLPNLIFKIAITGSVGKTTTKDFTAFLLSKKYKVHKTEGNKNNEIGVPLTLLSSPYDTEILCIEMGMNHPGEIKRMSECLLPDFGIITNIGTSHIGNLGSREMIAKAKLEILFGMNKDRLLVPYGEPLLEKLGDFKTFSTTDENANFYLKEYPNGEIEIYRDNLLFCRSKLSLRGYHFKKCLIAASSLSVLCELDSKSLSEQISKISNDNIRQKLIRLNKFYFYTDYYNSSPESLRASYDAMRFIEIASRKSLVIGDIGELGDHTNEIHFMIGKEIPKDIFSHVFIFGKMAETVKQGAIENGFSIDKIHINTDPQTPGITASQIKEYCVSDEAILIKGSRMMCMERILDYF